MSDPTTISPPGLLTRAIRAVPAVKYALGIGGIIAVIAIVSSFGLGFQVAFFGTIVMLVLMTVLVIFASFAGQPSSSFHAQALVFTWFSLILFMATAVVLFTSVFWGSPVDLRNLLGVKIEAVHKPEQQIEPTPAKQLPDAVVNRQPVAVKPAEHNTQPKTHSVHKKTTPPKQPETTLVAQVPKTADPQPAIDERRSMESEHEADDSAWWAIVTMNEAVANPQGNDQGRVNMDRQEAQQNWALAIKGWNVALKTAHDPQRISNLRTKIAQRSGLTCNVTHNCIVNGTGFHHYQDISVPIAELPVL